MGLAGFLLAITLFDSGGLFQWAQRLDIGPMRTIAVPVTAELDHIVSPLQFDRIQLAAVAGLGRLGWSDDPSAQIGEAGSSHPAGTNLRDVSTGDMDATLQNCRSGDRVMPAQNLVMVVPPVSRPTPETLQSQPDVVTTTLPMKSIHAKLSAPPNDQTPNKVAVAPFRNGLPPLLPVPPGRPRVVALVGDSMMAVGLSDVFLQNSVPSHIKIIKAFRSGTGLARPDVFNWMVEYPAMVGDARPDVIFVAIGANDTQGYVDADGEVLRFGTTGWIDSYQGRVKAFMDMLEKSGRQIVWIGMPPMRMSLYNSHVKEINQITRNIVSTYPNAVWWNPTPYIGNTAGNFRGAGLITVNGNQRYVSLRQPDGIHMTDDGASLLTAVFLPWLQTPADH